MGIPLIPQFTPEAASPTGALVFNYVGEAIFAAGDSVPADATAGYGEGCVFLKNGGAADAQVYVNIGDGASCNFDPLILSNVLLANQTIAGGAAAGITGGTGTVFEQSRIKIGNIYKTTFLIDLTGLGSSTTLGDIIGQGVSAAYIAKLTAAEVGTTIDAVLMTCLEAPATGVNDIDLYSATEGTGKFDDAVSGLTETQLIDSGAAWTNGRQLGATTVPLSTEYIYLTNGTLGTVGTYTAGKFLIEIYGH